MTDVVTVEELTELRKLLNSEEAIKHAKLGLKTAAADLINVLIVYPPPTAGNQARGFNTVISPKTGKFNNMWYHRGYGSRWARKDGSIGERNNSEDLQHSWTQKAEHAGMTQVVGTNVSYAPYVMRGGTTDPHQTTVHATNGWKTVQTIAKQEEERLVKVVRDQIAKAFHTK